ncbi:uncharacterized protein LOC142338460 [Convolutriloba macropyga]|uniref:uncharacterized protein LOC142338460 n=1 Tax=Convolutriloba macropyga TaxID=536237 RepID=UPI003F51DDCF
MMSSEKGRLEGIGKRYLDVLRDVEFQLDSFDMMLHSKWKIRFSNYFRWLIIYLQVAFGHNWWKIFSHVVTIGAAIILLLIDRSLSYSYGNLCSYDYGYIYCPNWFTYMFQPEDVFKWGGRISLALIMSSFLVDLICASKAVRKRSEICVLCIDLTLAVLQCLTWIFLLVVSWSSWKEFRYSEYRSRTLYLFVGNIAALFGTLAQMTIIVVTMAKIVRDWLKTRTQQRQQKQQSTTPEVVSDSQADVRVHEKL